MKNTFLVKIQTNVNQRNHVHNSFFSEVSHTIKIQNFDHQNWSDFFLYNTLYFFARLIGFPCFWYLNATYQPVGS